MGIIEYPARNTSEGPPQKKVDLAFSKTDGLELHARLVAQTKGKNKFRGKLKTSRIPQNKLEKPEIARITRKKK